MNLSPLTPDASLVGLFSSFWPFWRSVNLNGNNASYWFYKCQKLTSVGLSKINFSADAAMSSMFAGCSSLSALDVTNWDTSRVTSVGHMFNGCSSLRSLTVGTGFTLDLSKTGSPVSTLYTADRTAVALAGVPKGVVATYYTKAEYVPQQPAGDEPAADQGSAVQNADAAANAVVGDAPDAGTTDADGSPASDGSVSDGDSAPSTDSASPHSRTPFRTTPQVPYRTLSPSFLSPHRVATGTSYQGAPSKHRWGSLVFG